jgi:hypothetical protein
MASVVDESADVRTRLTKIVQWQPARDAIKYAAHAAARGRAQVLERSGKMPPIANVFAGSCPKSGSQWIKALLHHPVVRKHTGLFTLPQLGYYKRSFRGFPGGTFVPGLYISYQDYTRYHQPLPHRMVYVFRDPRDIVVSAYFSAFTHREILDLKESRTLLESMPIDEALTWVIHNGEDHLRDMATWVGVANRDETVRTWRLEDIGADYAAAVPDILAFCGVTLADDEMATVIAETSREALQQQDLSERKVGSESHYRIERKGYRELFKPEHYAEVERIVPGFIEQLGYEPSPTS